MKILGVTACPSGVAHTYMAAEALANEAKALGHEVKVETQGSIGIENEITAEDVKNADVVILTKDIAIKNKERFKGLPIVNVSIADVIKKTNPLLKKVEAYVKSKQNG
ncbi:PTS fructose-like transporter subunit IIB [Haloimpatiens sp. FM7330]|uniref:PTS fructose-like transporter subunit IIB n=1 Tax=Haloimpatiens sp. FM7330 TaxID=3298610 RepID=UPI0036346373